MEARLEQIHSVKSYKVVASILAALAVVGAGVALYAAYSHHSSINDLSLEDYTQMGTSLLMGGTLAAYLIFAYFDKANSKKVKATLAVVLLALAGVGLYYSGLYDGFKGQTWDRSALVLTGGALVGFSVMGIIGLFDTLNIRKQARMQHSMNALHGNTINLLDVLSFEEDKHMILVHFARILPHENDKMDERAAMQGWTAMAHALNTPQNNLLFPPSESQMEKIAIAFNKALTRFINKLMQNMPAERIAVKINRY